MQFRSHLGRPVDLRVPSNRLVALLSVVAAAGAVVLWLSGEPSEILLAPIHVFLIWALLRELDPDHDWTALVAAGAAGAWALAGWPTASLLAVGGLMLAARVLAETTGRRPLTTDLVVVAAGATAIGFTVEGWIAGFTIAVALYIDDRLAEESRPSQLWAAAFAAAGTTVVATLTSGLPSPPISVSRYVVILAGVLGLLLVLREPSVPRSHVDRRKGGQVSPVRLHLARSTVGVAVFTAALLTGAEADGLSTILVAISMAVISNEIELARSHTR